MFTFGKGQSASSPAHNNERKVESETIKRWRQVAHRGLNEGDDVESEIHADLNAAEDAGSNTELDSDYEVTAELVISTDTRTDEWKPAMSLEEESIEVEWTMNGSESLKKSDEPSSRPPVHEKLVEPVIKPAEVSSLQQATRQTTSGIKAEPKQGVPAQVASTRAPTAPAVTPTSLSSNIEVKVLPSDPAMSFEDDIRRRFGTNVKSALGPGTVIEGKFTFESPVSIDGNLTGEVFSSSVLIVGEHANINAKIHVGSLVVLGRVNGEVRVKDLVEIKPSGHLEADIYTKRFVMDQGGFYSGVCKMRE